jgi:hypothetical protein
VVIMALARDQISSLLLASTVFNAALIGAPIGSCRSKRPPRVVVVVVCVWGGGGQ